MTNAPSVNELEKSMLFILRADSTGPGNKHVRKATKILKPLWNPKKL